MLYGAHVSSAGGISTAIDRAEELDCDAVQIFTQSPQMWKPTVHSDEQVARFREAIGFLVRLGADHRNADAAFGLGAPDRRPEILAIGGHDLVRDRLFVIQWKEGCARVAKRDNSCAVANRNDRFDRVGGETRKGLHQPVADSGNVEPLGSVHQNRRIRPHDAIDHPARLVPQADLAQRLAEIDDNGGATGQALLSLTRTQSLSIIVDHFQ